MPPWLLVPQAILCHCRGFNTLPRFSPPQTPVSLYPYSLKIRFFFYNIRTYREDTWFTKPKAQNPYNLTNRYKYLRFFNTLLDSNQFQVVYDQHLECLPLAFLILAAICTFHLMPNTLHSVNRFIPSQVSYYQHPPLIRTPSFLRIRTPTFPSTHYPFLPSFLSSSIPPSSFVACQLILSLPHFITPVNAHLHHAPLHLPLSQHTPLCGNASHSRYLNHLTRRHYT